MRFLDFFGNIERTRCCLPGMKRICHLRTNYMGCVIDSPGLTICPVLKKVALYICNWFFALKFMGFICRKGIPISWGCLYAYIVTGRYKYSVVANQIAQARIIVPGEDGEGLFSAFVVKDCHKAR